MKKNKKYPAYKDSGIEWIGEIPEHWEKGRISALFEERNVKVSDKEYAPLSVTKVGVVPQLDRAAKSKDSENRKLVCKGDFVINSRSDRKGSSGTSQLEGSVSLINTVLKPKVIKPLYAEHLLKSYGFVEEFYRNGRGIVADLWSTNFSRMKLIQIPLPPLSEQKKIASFLDKKTVEIDKAIELKQKENELLKERRQVAINRAVTRGLNPNVTYKDSGIEWIGEIPEHWEVRKFRYLFSYDKGRKARNEYDYLQFDFLPYVNMEYVRGGSSNTFIDFKKENIVLVNEGDLILLWDGSNAGEFHISPRGVLASTLSKINLLHNRLDDKFIYFLVKLSETDIKLNTIGMGIPHVSGEYLKNIKFPLPPLSEQKEIAEYLEELDEKTNRLLDLNNRAIDKLKEYKQVLIDQAVRGQICLV